MIDSQENKVFKVGSKNIETKKFPMAAAAIMYIRKYYERYTAYPAVIQMTEEDHMVYMREINAGLNSGPVTYKAADFQLHAVLGIPIMIIEQPQATKNRKARRRR